MSAIKEMAASAPIDHANVSRIKDAITRGEYPIDIDRISEALLEAYKEMKSSWKTFNVSESVQMDKILQRVGQMLDALELHGQSSVDFKSRCDELQSYLNNQTDFLTSGQNIDTDSRQLLQSIIQRLSELQKRAQLKSTIPADLQKYIAERDD